jgi:uncharacterized membrane protein/cytochrome c556
MTAEVMRFSVRAILRGILPSMISDLFPPIPPYDGLHPIVVHFPIALLLTVPFFVVLASIWKSQSRSLLLSALILCLLGTGLTYLATSTGESAEQFAETVPGIGSTLDEHEDLADLSQKLFLGVCALMIAVTGLYWKYHGSTSTSLRFIMAAIVLILYAGPSLVLVNAASLGGRLVHEHGAKARLSAIQVAPGVANGGGGPIVIGLLPRASTDDSMQADATPPNTRRSGLAKTMADVNEVMDRLKVVQNADWKSSQDPDPASEAASLADMLGMLQDDDRVKSKPSDFHALLKAASAEASALGRMLSEAEVDPEKLSNQLTRIEQSCTHCHEQFRD